MVRNVRTRGQRGRPNKRALAHLMILDSVAHLGDWVNAHTITKDIKRRMGVSFDYMTIWRYSKELVKKRKLRRRTIFGRDSYSLPEKAKKKSRR